MKKVFLCYIFVNVLFGCSTYARNSASNHLMNYDDWPSDTIFQAILNGHVTDAENGEELAGANVVIYKNGVLKQGSSTDFDGEYSITIDGGNYDIEIMYAGYLKIKQKGIVNGKTLTLDVKMVGDSTMINSGVAKPCLKIIQNDGSTGSGLQAIDIKNLPTRDVRQDTITTIPESNHSNQLRVGSGRAESTAYYVDGVRISGKGLLPPAKVTFRQKVKNKFKRIRTRLKL
jgi:hypothetical protein